VHEHLSLPVDISTGWAEMKPPLAVIFEKANRLQRVFIGSVCGVFAPGGSRAILTGTNHL
jgi:hypothetical protein